MTCLTVLNGDDKSPFPSQRGAADSLQAVWSGSSRHVESEVAALMEHTREGLGLLTLREQTASLKSSRSSRGSLGRPRSRRRRPGRKGPTYLTSGAPRVESPLARLIRLNKTLEEISENIENNALAPAGHIMHTLFAETSGQGRGALDFLVPLHPPFRAGDDVNDFTVVDLFLVHDDRLPKAVQFERARFKNQLPRVLHQLLLRQASVIDAIVTGAFYVALCSDIKLDFPQPTYPNMCAEHWHDLGVTLVSLSRPEADSEILPEPLQVLYDLGTFAEMEPTLEWLRSQGEILIAMAEVAGQRYGDIILPKIVPLETLARMGAELHKVYTVGTERIANRHKYDIPESIPMALLKMWQLEPGHAGYLDQPKVWLEEAQGALEELRDLATTLTTFCSAAACLPARDIESCRRRSVDHEDTEVLAALAALNNIYSIETPRIVAKIKRASTNDREGKRQQRRLLREAKRLEDILHLSDGEDKLRAARCRLYGPRYLSPSKCLVPEGFLLMDENALQKLHQSQAWLNTMIGDVRQTREIAGST